MNGLTLLQPDGTAKPLYIPTEKQLEYHARTEPNVLFWGGRGSGKAHRLSTTIPTPQGLKTILEIQIGDQVFDELGQPCNVVWKSEPHIDMHGTFRITFDDGTTIVSGGHHEWLTMTAYERRKAIKRTTAYRLNRKLTRSDSPRKNALTDGRGRYVRKNLLMSPLGEIRTTREINATLREYRFTGYGLGESNHSIAVAKAWQLPTRTFILAPYVLGVWLGDGSKNSGQVTGVDQGVFDGITSHGWEVKKTKKGITRNVVGLVTVLKQLKVYRNKHIPEEYFLGSEVQRLSLLQGLMDTDGTCGKSGQAVFTNTNQNLAEGVFRLAASLGLKPNITESRATLYGKDCGPVWDVGWTSTTPVFCLQRKLDRLHTKTRSTTTCRYIVNIEQIPDELLQCIEVDSASHLYLVTNACIPTHNSMCGRWDAHLRALTHPGFTYCILRRTYPELQRSHLVHITREMSQLGGSFHHTDRIASYPNGSKGFFSHCATEDDVMNLLSAEFALMVFDELSTFEWEMFTKLAASVRVPINSGLTAMVRGLTNPLGPSASKILQYFVDKNVSLDEDPDYNPNDWYSIHANLEDNPHLDQVQYRKRFSGLPAHVRKAWVDGEFVLENALFDLEPKRNGKPYHVVPDIDLKKVLKSATVYRAIDAGWFPDPTVVLWIAHLGNRYIVFNEMIRYRRTAVEIAEEIKAEDKRLGVTKCAISYCDPSMDINTTADIRTVKEIYEQNGIPMECSINNREEFAFAMHNALAEEAGENLPRIQFYVNGRDGCPYLVRTIPQMRYNQKRPKAMDDHREDHAVVACCYFLMTHSADARANIPGVDKLRPWMRKKNETRFVLGADQVRDKGPY